MTSIILGCKVISVSIVANNQHLRNLRWRFFSGAAGGTAGFAGAGEATRGGAGLALGDACPPGGGGAFTGCGGTCCCCGEYPVG